jgi:hypothetical protein
VPYLIGVACAVGVGALVQGSASYLYALDRAKDLTTARLWSIPVGLLMITAAAASGSTISLACAPVAAQLVQLAAVRSVLARVA